jgi:hypothetical protein
MVAVKIEIGQVQSQNAKINKILGPQDNSGGRHADLLPERIVAAVVRGDPRFTKNG